MGKVINERLATQDDEIFSSGVMISSSRRSKPSSMSSASDTAGATLANMKSRMPRREDFDTREDFLEARAFYLSTMSRIKGARPTGLSEGTPASSDDTPDNTTL